MTKTYPQFTIIGITGLMGSGKTTASLYAEEKGIHRIDCDQIVHELYEPNQLGAIKIQAFFEGKYLDKQGRVNRKKLLKELFKHPKKWEVLSRMIHPLVAEKIRRQLKQLERGVVLIEIPIYHEKVFGEFIDELWRLEISPQKQRQNLEKKALTTEQIRAINRVHYADKHPQTHIIENNDSLKELYHQLDKLLSPHL